MEKYQGRALLLILIVSGAIYYLLDPGQYILFPKCIFYATTGFYCPGCGSQRAIHNLLHLNIPGVAGNNILFLPAALAIGYHYSHRAINENFNLNLPNVFYMKSTPWIIFGIIVVFWVARNLTLVPFSFLAPG